MATPNVMQSYGVEVRHKSGGCYTAYVDAYNEDHAKRQVKKDLERGEYISGVTPNTPKEMYFAPGELGHLCE